jgi:hypothetical protein
VTELLGTRLAYVDGINFEDKLKDSNSGKLHLHLAAAGTSTTRPIAKPELLTSTAIALTSTGSAT